MGIKSGDVSGVIDKENSNGGISEFPDDPGSVEETNPAVQTDNAETADKNAGQGETENSDKPIKRGPGRPRKNPVQTGPVEFDPAAEIAAAKPAKRVKPVKASPAPKIPYTAPLEDKDIVLPSGLVGTAEILLTKLFGPEMEFTGPEKTQLVDVWARYFRSLGLTDLPPGWLAAITTGLIIAPKLGQPGPRARIGQWTRKLTGKRDAVPPPPVQAVQSA